MEMEITWHLKKVGIGSEPKICDQDIPRTQPAIGTKYPTGISISASFTSTLPLAC